MSILYVSVCVPDKEKYKYTYKAQYVCVCLTSSVTLCSFSIYEGWLNGECCRNNTVQLEAAPLTLMQLKWLLCQRSRLFRWKRSKGVLFSLWLALTLNTAISQQWFQPVKWHVAAFASQQEEGNKEEYLLLGPEKVDCIVFRAQRHWLPVGDEPVSQSSSPYPWECWHFQCDGSVCSFLAFSCCFTSADHYFHLACSAECVSHIINYLLSG